VTLSQWAIGMLLVAVQAIACAVAGHGLRRRLVPAWDGPVAVVAAAVLGVTVLVGASQLLGSVGLLRQWSLPALLVVAAWLCTPGWSRRRLHGRAPAPDVPAAGRGQADLAADADGDSGARGARWQVVATESRVANAAALLAVVAVSASWVERVVAVYRRGMTDGDSLMYHLPFAARFVQTGWTTGTDAIGPDAWVAFYPANVELIEASLILPFGSDVLVPLMNLGWLALALAAAWSIGAVVGRPALGVVMGAVPLAVPVMAATQGGTGRVDGATIALLLAAVALVLQQPRTTASCGVAGLALGLAIGTKMAVLPLAGLLLVTVALALWRRHGGLSVAAWGGATAVACGYWYVRNWVVTGNPVPALDLSIGPVGFAPLPADRIALLDNSSIAENVDLPGFWANIAHPVLDGIVGSIVLAVAIILTAVVAAALVAVQRPWGLRHAVTASAVGGCVAYVFAPYSAPLLGNGTDSPTAALIVGLNVRYLLPSLAVLLCMLPVGLERRSRTVGDVMVVAGAGAVAYLWFESTRLHGEWPMRTSDTVIGVAVVAAAVLVVLAGMHVAGDRGRATPGPVPVAAVVLVAVIVGGAAVSAWVAADRSGLHSYSAMPSNAVALMRAADATPGRRIALLDGWVQYPYLGADIGSVVDYVGLPADHGLSDPPRDCDEVWQALARHDYDVVVVQQPLFDRVGSIAGNVECLLADERAELVERNGAGAVFALS